MPQLDVDALTSREEAYTENGGGEGFNLRVQPYYANSLRAFLGADIRQDVNFGDFYLQPELRAGYRYDFVDGATKLKANFASVDTLNGQAINQFTIEGPDPGRGNVVLGGGVATTTGAWSIGVNYDYVRGGNGPTEQTGIITLLGRI
jgi:autotransporter-like protein